MLIFRRYWSFGIFRNHDCKNQAVTALLTIHRCVRSFGELLPSRNAGGCHGVDG